MRRFDHPPTLDDIVDLAGQAFPAIPEELRALVKGAAIVVEEVADEKTAQDLGFDSPWAITGLYRRAARTQKSVLNAHMETERPSHFRIFMLQSHRKLRMSPGSKLRTLAAATNSSIDRLYSTKPNITF